MKSIKLFILVYTPFHPIAHDQHSKQAVGTLIWMANMCIYPQLSQIKVLVGSDEYHMRTPVYMFPLTPSLFSYTLTHHWRRKRGGGGGGGLQPP